MATYSIIWVDFKADAGTAREAGFTGEISGFNGFVCFLGLSF